MPITVAFTVASIYAVAITRGIKLEERIRQYSRGASDPNILLMIWIFVLLVPSLQVLRVWVPLTRP